MTAFSPNNAYTSRANSMDHNTRIAAAIPDLKSQARPNIAATARRHGVVRETLSKRFRGKTRPNLFVCRATLWVVEHLFFQDWARFRCRFQEADGQGTHSLQGLFIDLGFLFQSSCGVISGVLQDLSLVYLGLDRSLPNMLFLKSLLCLWLWDYLRFLFIFCSTPPFTIPSNQLTLGY